MAKDLSFPQPFEDLEEVRGLALEVCDDPYERDKRGNVKELDESRPTHYITGLYAKWKEMKSNCKVRWWALAAALPTFGGFLGAWHWAVVSPIHSGMEVLAVLITLVCGAGTVALCVASAMFFCSANEEKKDLRAAGVLGEPQLLKDADEAIRGFNRKINILYRFLGMEISRWGDWNKIPEQLRRYATREFQRLKEQREEIVVDIEVIIHASQLSEDEKVELAALFEDTSHLFEKLHDQAEERRLLTPLQIELDVTAEAEG